MITDNSKSIASYIIMLLTQSPPGVVQDAFIKKRITMLRSSMDFGRSSLLTFTENGEFLYLIAMLVLES